MRKPLNFMLKHLGVELHKYVPIKTPLGHAIDTIAYSLNHTPPNDFLIELATNAITRAWQTEIDNKDTLHLNDSHYFNIYPGEHYRLLKAIALELKPKTVVEIGTHTGMGSLALTQGLPQASKVHTYDIVSWDQLPSHLNKNFFSSKKITQHLFNLADLEHFSSNQEIIESAEFIFCDGPKDGDFEYKFVSNLSTLKPSKRRILMLDDIRFKNMIDLWQSINSPKLDLSSFGHWSGTGLVDISNGLQIKQFS
jgi:predicted O-methyltransferase YrrM